MDEVSSQTFDALLVAASKQVEPPALGVIISSLRMAFCEWILTDEVLMLFLHIYNRLPRQVNVLFHHFVVLRSPVHSITFVGTLLPLSWRVHSLLEHVFVNEHYVIT